MSQKKPETKKNTIIVKKKKRKKSKILKILNDPEGHLKEFTLF